MKLSTPVIIYGSLVLFMILPLLSALLGSLIAACFGCQMTDGPTTPCSAFGRDISRTIDGFLVVGWASLLTVPVGGFGIIAYTVVLAIIKNRTR